MIRVGCDSINALAVPDPCDDFLGDLERPDSRNILTNDEHRAKN